MFSYYNDEDRALESMLDRVALAAPGVADGLERNPDVKTFPVHFPDWQYGFLHEAAVISYHGTLFASWYNCPREELILRSPIRERRSKDGGRTWSEPYLLADDPSGSILYCPPVYGVCDDTLYMLMNEMVSPDHIHALNLYRYDEKTETYALLWSRPIPFKLNTNVISLPNGKLMLPGRIAEMDGFPNTPAVLISDSGKIDAKWRLVRLQESGALPDGSELVHPEISAVLDGNRVYMFCRDDRRRVPLVYFSDDCGEHWTRPMAHNLPLSDSKIYAGDLSDGRHYLIANLYPGRSRLAVFFSAPGKPYFDRGFLLQDGLSEAFPVLSGRQWSYPAAWEQDGFLYVIYTAEIKSPIRGALMSVIPL